MVEKELKVGDDLYVHHYRQRFPYYDIYCRKYTVKDVIKTHNSVTNKTKTTYVYGTWNLKINSKIAFDRYPSEEEAMRLLNKYVKRLNRMYITHEHFCGNYIKE